MNPDNQSIGELAYRLWQSRGSPDGSAEQDWLEAERLLAGDKQPVAVPAPVSGPSSAPIIAAKPIIADEESLARSRTASKPAVTGSRRDRPS